MKEIHKEPSPAGPLPAGPSHAGPSDAGPSAAGFEALHSAAHMSGRREELGMQEQYSTGDCNAGAGLGPHRPATHRESPHFQRAPMEAALDICGGEARCVYVRGLYAGETVYAALLPVEALRGLVDADDLKFEDAMPNRKDGYRLLDILRSSNCRRVARNGLNTPDYRQPTREILGTLGRRPLLRQSIFQNEKSYWRS